MRFSGRADSKAGTPYLNGLTFFVLKNMLWRGLNYCVPIYINPRRIDDLNFFLTM